MLHQRLQRGNLRVEALEPRRLMAGDVTAAIVKGSLVLQGEDAGDDITITQIATAKFDVTGNNGTTINGQSGVFEADAVKKNISVTIGNGDSSVALNGIVLKGNVQVTLGDGNDTVDVESASLGGLSIQAGNGQDSFTIGTAPILSPAVATTVAKTPPAGVKVDNNLSIASGLGGDDVSIATTKVGGNLSLQLGDGIDTVSLGSSSAPPANANGKVPKFDVKVGGSLSINTGASADTVTLDSVHAASVNLDTGAGDDVVTLTDTKADSFFAALGSGDDTLDTSGGGDTIKWFTASGDDGSNTYLSATSNSFKHTSLLDFDSNS